MKFNLLLALVPHGKSDLISEAASKAGSFGGTVCSGRNISGGNFITALGLGEKPVDLIYILTEESSTRKIADAIIEISQHEKISFGTLYTLETNEMLKGQKIQGGKATMENKTEYELITIILNRGYAEDAMAAARKAGATGGTVINARGTAKEDDEKFFGMHIVPEKEMLQIVCDSKTKDAVMEAIKNLSCLKEPGSGIAWCTNVKDLTMLGKK